MNVSGVKCLTDQVLFVGLKNKHLDDMNMADGHFALISDIQPADEICSDRSQLGIRGS